MSGDCTTIFSQYLIDTVLLWISTASAGHRCTGGWEQEVWLWWDWWLVAAVSRCQCSHSSGYWQNNIRGKTLNLTSTSASVTAAPGPASCLLLTAQEQQDKQFRYTLFTHPFLSIVYKLSDLSIICTRYYAFGGNWQVVDLDVCHLYVI